MYQRDVAAENKETLERLVMALDELTRVVSKDDTSRTILDVLKEKGAKDVKEIPASDGQAEEIKTRYRSGGGGGQAGGTRGAEFQDWNLTTLARLNQAFRALQGDLGAFQRTLVNAAHWGNQALNAGRVAESVASTVTEAAKPKPVYRKATDEEIEAAMKDAASKGMSGMEMLKVAEKLAKQGIEVTPEAGTVANQVAQNIKTTAGQTVTPQAATTAAQIAQGAGQVVQGARGVVSPARVGGVATAGISTQQLASIATTAALVAAPAVLSRLVTSNAIKQIEELRNFRVLDGRMAGSFAMYDFNRMLSNMRIASGITQSTERLLQSQTEFNKTMEPIKTASTNLWNNLLASGLKVLNDVATPLSSTLKVISGQVKNVDEALNVANDIGMGGFGLLSRKKPTIDNWINAGQEMGVIGAGILGGALKNEEKEKMKGIGVFSEQIASTAICPPRRFVP